MPVLKALSQQLLGTEVPEQMMDDGGETAQWCSGRQGEQKPMMDLPFCDGPFNDKAAFA